MNKKKFVSKLVLFFAVMILLRFFIIAGIGLANESLTNYIEPSEGKIVVNQPLGYKINTVRISRFSVNNKKEWNFNIADGVSFFIFFNNLLGDTSVFVEEEKIMQNKDADKDKYFPSKSYFAFRADEYIEEQSHVAVEGEEISQTSMYLIKNEYYSQVMELRSFIKSLLFTILLIFTGISIFLRFQYKADKRKLFFIFHLNGSCVYC